MLKAVLGGVGWDYVTENVFYRTLFGNQIIDCVYFSIDHTKGQKQISVIILGVFGRSGNLHAYMKAIIKKIFGSFR